MITPGVLGKLRILCYALWLAQVNAYAWYEPGGQISGETFATLMIAVHTMNHEIVDISPKQAHDMTLEDTRTVLVDVRSSMEYLFVGHPVGAVNIPWIDEPDWVENPHFAAEVRKLVLGGAVCDTDEGCAPVILICRSGKRSKEAAQRLLEGGFRRVYNVDTGFEGDLNEHHRRSTIGGWRFDGLPWEQC